MKMRWASKAYGTWRRALGSGESWCGGGTAIKRTKGRKGVWCSRTERAARSLSLMRDKEKDMNGLVEEKRGQMRQDLILFQEQQMATEEF